MISKYNRSSIQIYSVKHHEFWKSWTVAKLFGNEMTERTVKALRVHGPGQGKDVEITFGGERLHASGVFANVYSARLYRPVEMAVAIKKTWPSGGWSVINPEVYYLSRMKHRCIITLLYHFTLTSNSETCHCMVFDYLPTDMAKLRLSKIGRRFPLLDAKLYSFQMFLAIDYVNALGIAHRDIKPSNMIVDDEKGILKLADFGNAKLLRKSEENTPYQVNVEKSSFFVRLKWTRSSRKKKNCFEICQINVCF